MNDLSFMNSSGDIIIGIVIWIIVVLLFLWQMSAVDTEKIISLDCGA